jgi:hypothetical protein
MLLIAAGSKVCTVSIFFLAAEGDGRANQFKRYLLWIIIGSYRCISFIAHLSILGKCGCYKDCHHCSRVITVLIANSIASVQSSVKTQIAYSSIVQIGIIFIEVALGFHTLALIHFTGNAFLRTYQLLVSPSVLSYLVHNQFYNFDPAKNKTTRTSANRISNSLIHSIHQRMEP